MQTALRKLKVLVLGLAGGTAVFVGVLVATMPAGSGAKEAPLLTYAALGWAVLVIVARFPLLAQVERDARRRIAARTYQATRVSRQSPLVEEHGDTGRFFLAYQTRTILGAALLDGGALFGAIAYRVDGHLLGAAIAIVLCLLVLLGAPARADWEAWLEAQQRLSEADRTN